MTQTITPQEVEERLFDALATMGPERADIHRDATFESLDVDSLDLVELLQVAEEEFGVQLNPEDAKDITTVGQAVDLVLARMP
jgi:acyl carrier protein